MRVLHVQTCRGVVRQNIECYVLGARGRGRDILFCHGLGRRPTHYKPFLQRLARARDARVVAPFLFGNGHLRYPPHDLAQCLAWSRALVEALERMGELGPSPIVIGHSTGATIGWQLASMRPEPGAILAINPLLPARHGTLGYALRALGILGRHLLGRSGDARAARGLVLRTQCDLMRSLLSAPLAHARLAGAIGRASRHDLEALVPAVPTVPSVLLIGAGDEFFPLAKPLADQLTLLLGPDRFHVETRARSHEWLLVQPELAADRAASLLDGARVCTECG